MGYQAHKFSLIDAIERASLLLGTDRCTEAEYVLVGDGMRAVLVTLPHMKCSEIDDEGLLPMKNGKPFLGTIGCRHYYWTGKPEMHLRATVSNGRTSGDVVVIETETNG